MEYSKALEREFQSVYGEIAKRSDKTIGDTVGFADADYAGCTVTFKSTSGCILYHRGCAIAWSSKRQTIRALSTCESEYCALYDLVRITQSQGYLDWFQEQGTLPVCFSDNQSALALANTTVTTKRSKHMEVRLHMLRDVASDLCYVPTSINKADPLTKVIPQVKVLQLFKTDKNDLPPEVECQFINVDLGAPVY